MKDGNVGRLIYFFYPIYEMKINFATWDFLLFLKYTLIRNVAVHLLRVSRTSSSLDFKTVTKLRNLPSPMFKMFLVLFHLK